MASVESFGTEKFVETRGNSFNPDKMSDMKFDFNKTGEKFYCDKVSDGKFDFSRKLSNIDKENSDTHEQNESSEFQSSYEERLNHTPKDGERGKWTGKRGESIYEPTDEEVKALLEKCGLTGIPYKDGIPDFSGVAEATVEIDNMTGQREGEGGNFEQADQALADKWNKEGKDGRTDWTASDVKVWRKEHGYTWHERNDMKTMDLVPTKIHQYFGHFGGCGECNIRDRNNKEEFDE